MNTWEFKIRKTVENMSKHMGTLTIMTIGFIALSIAIGYAASYVLGMVGYSDMFTVITFISISFAGSCGAMVVYGIALLACEYYRRKEMLTETTN